jgi:hypothetical protein
LRLLQQSPRGISVVLDPTGTPLGEALCRDEGIVYATIDLAQGVEPKQFHDVVGSYNRFDIFTLSVDRSARPPATFVDARRDSAAEQMGLRRKTHGPARWLGGRAAQTGDPLRSGRPRSRLAGPGDRSERKWKPSRAGRFGRLLGDLNRHLRILVLLPLIAVLLASVFLALLLFWIC